MHFSTTSWIGSKSDFDFKVKPTRRSVRSKRSAISMRFKNRKAGCIYIVLTFDKCWCRGCHAQPVRARLQQTRRLSELLPHVA